MDYMQFLRVKEDLRELFAGCKNDKEIKTIEADLIQFIKVQAYTNKEEK